MIRGRNRRAKEEGLGLTGLAIALHKRDIVLDRTSTALPIGRSRLENAVREVFRLKAPPLAKEVSLLSGHALGGGNGVELLVQVTLSVRGDDRREAFHLLGVGVAGVSTVKHQSLGVLVITAMDTKAKALRCRVEVVADLKKK